jgi:hypothetical protein
MAEVHSHTGIFFGSEDTEQLRQNLSEIFWSKFCDDAPGFCPKDKPAAKSLKAFGLAMEDGALGGKLVSTKQAGLAAGLTVAKALELLMNPEKLRGADPEYVVAVAEKAGFSSAPMKPTSATGGRGTRMFLPGDSAVMLFEEEGDPNYSGKDVVHRGPYLKIQIAGGGKNGASRIPLAGNPEMSSGGFRRWGQAAEAFFEMLMARGNK